jgi:hypothetical protein
MEEFKVKFEYNNIQYDLRIRPLQKGSLPTVFQVVDNKNYFKGQLIWYSALDRWSFYENNGPDNAPVAQILADYVVLWYQ